jgi:transposase
LRVTDAIGRPISFFMSAGQVSHYTGAAALLRNLPEANWLIADPGCDADWFRDSVKDNEVKPCMPDRKARRTSEKYDKRRYKRRNWIEIMFGRLNDWRKIAKRFDRCPQVFLSAVALAATVRFWLRISLSLAPSIRHLPSKADESTFLRNRGPRADWIGLWQTGFSCMKKPAKAMPWRAGASHGSRQVYSLFPRN